jgi:hypothetical protein
MFIRNKRIIIYFHNRFICVGAYTWGIKNIGFVLEIINFSYKEKLLVILEKKFKIHSTHVKIQQIN